MDELEIMQTGFFVICMMIAFGAGVLIGLLLR